MKKKEDISIIIDKTTIKAGEPIKGELLSDTPLTVKLFVLFASLLFPSRYNIPKIRTLYYKEMTVPPGRFEITYPQDLPPAIYTKAHKVRWSLVFGFPKFGGRILYPRKEVRIKVYPRRPPIREPEPWIKLDKDLYRSDDVVRAIILDPDVDPRDTFIEIEGEEWLVFKGKKDVARYSLAEGKALKEGDKVIAEVKLPYDPALTKDVFLFFPYTFEYESKELAFGSKVNLVVDTTDWVRRVEIPVWAGEPRYKIVKEAEKERKGPLFPI